jgi:hypothetical protein
MFLFCKAAQVFQKYFLWSSCLGKGLFKVREIEQIIRISVLFEILLDNWMQMDCVKIDQSWLFLGMVNFALVCRDGLRFFEFILVVELFLSRELFIVDFSLEIFLNFHQINFQISLFYIKLYKLLNWVFLMN